MTSMTLDAEQAATGGSTTPPPVSAQARMQEVLKVTWGETLTFQSRQSILASRPPVQVLNAFAAGYPQLTGLTDIIKSDERLMTAFHSAISKDSTFLPGLERLASTPGGNNMLRQMETQLRDPNNRQMLTTALNNLADREDIKFNHLEELVNASQSGDPRRASQALVGVGVPQAQATQIVSQQGIKNFLGEIQDFFRNPEQGAGRFGATLENMGVPKGLAGFITGFLQMMAKFMGNLPGMISGAWQGSQYQAFKEVHVDPAIARTTARGQESILAARAATPATSVPVAGTTSRIDPEATRARQPGTLAPAFAGPTSGTDLSGNRTNPPVVAPAPAQPSTVFTDPMTGFGGPSMFIGAP